MPSSRAQVVYFQIQCKTAMNAGWIVVENRRSCGTTPLQGNAKYLPGGFDMLAGLLTLRLQINALQTSNGRP